MTRGHRRLQTSVHLWSHAFGKSFINNYAVDSLANSFQGLRLSPLAKPRCQRETTEVHVRKTCCRRERYRYRRIACERRIVIDAGWRCTIVQNDQKEGRTESISQSHFACQGGVY